MSFLVTQFRFVVRFASSSPDGQPARLVPAAHSQSPESNPGSPPCPANDADWPLCSPGGKPALNSSVDGGGYVGRDGINLGNAGTYAFSAVSLVDPQLYTNDGGFSLP